MKIVIDDKIPYIKGALEPVAEVIYLPGGAITREHLMDAEAMIIRTRTKCNAQLLDGTGVKFIATATIGHDHIDAAYCRKAGIRWTNAPGCNSGSVEQYIVSALLFLAEQKKLRLKGKSLGVIGVGNVGSKVVRAAKALGCRVLMTDPPRADQLAEPNPSEPNPSATGPSATSPSAADPTGTSPSTDEPSATNYYGADSSTANSSAANSSTVDSSAANSSAANPSSANPSSADPSAANPSSAVPSSANQIATDPTAAKPPEDVMTAKDFIPLETLLRESDIITVHVPLNKDGKYKTLGMADEHFFGLMKPGAIFINSSRGDVVDQEALKAALRSGSLLAAVLDVFAGEPEMDSELLELLTLATPHIAGYSADGKANGTMMSVQAMSREFRLGLDGWVPLAVPEPEQKEIFSDGAEEDEEVVVREVYGTTYEIADDHSRLMENPASFEALRGAYPIRREPHAYSVRVFNDDGKYREIFEELRFNVIGDSCM